MKHTLPFLMAVALFTVGNAQAASIVLTSNITFASAGDSYLTFEVPGKQLQAGNCSLHGYIGDAAHSRAGGNSVTLPAGSIHSVWKKVENSYFYDSDGGGRSFQTVISATISGFRNSYVTAICTVPAEQGLLPFMWHPVTPVPTQADLQAMFANYFILRD